MKLRRHPPAQDLKEWLVGGGSAETDTHIATCGKCASELEKIAETSHPLPDSHLDNVSQILATVLQPPEDLTNRLEERVVARLNSKELLGIFADLFGAGLETSKLLLTEEPLHGND